MNRSLHINDDFDDDDSDFGDAMDRDDESDIDFQDCLQKEDYAVAYTLHPEVTRIPRNVDGEENLAIQRKDTYDWGAARRRSTRRTTKKVGVKRG